MSTTSSGPVLDDEGSRSCLLYHPHDRLFLSDILCFVRSQIEVFVASPTADDDDKRPRSCGFEEAARLGRVGIRCVHCARNRGRNVAAERVSSERSANGVPPPSPLAPSSGVADGATTKGAMLFPGSIRLVNQTVRNWQRYHMLACPSMPEEVKRQYVALRAEPGKRRSGGASGQYWEDSCRRMGMIDTPSGIRLRSGRFVDIEEDTQHDEVVLDSYVASLKQYRLSPKSEKNEEEIQNNDIVLDGSMASLKQSLLVSKSGNFEKERQLDDIVLDGSMASLKQSLLASKSVVPVSLPVSERDSAGEENSNAGSNDLAKDNLADACFPRARALQDGNATVEPSIYPSNPPEKSHEEGDASNVHVSEDASGNMAQHNSKRSNRSSPGSILTANETLLERVKYALSVVDAASWIRPVIPLPLSCAAEDEFKAQDVNPTRQQQHEHQRDMSSLGAELYELFSGHNLYEQCRSVNREEVISELQSGSAVSTEDEDEEEDSARPQRKRREDSSRGGVIPLSQLDLPPVLCCIVSSLLEYRADDERRDYASMVEVEEDLRAIVADPERFLYRTPSAELNLNSSTLYGREDDISSLLEAYDRVVSADAHKNCVALVSGYSGTGKSSLVQEVMDRLWERGVICSSGKFDAMQQPTPLSAIASAVNDLCGILVQHPERAEEVKRKASQSALGGDGSGLLASLMPNVRRIIPRIKDDGPPLQIGGREAMQRLMFLFRGLIRATCSCSHPVVLFLDDLQWADSVSLELLRTLVMDVEMRGLFVVAAYRDNEVSADSHHPLALCLDRICRSGSTDIHSVHLSNLNLDNVNSLISEALYLTPRLTRSLAKVVISKTGGNALFVVQFLSSLRDEGLLRFSLTSRCWVWDIEQVREKDIADNVVELMTAKLLGLAPEVHEVLKVSAALGAQCRDALFQILDRAPDTITSIIAALDAAVSEGLLVKTGCAYRFPHDEIQRAAYLLIPESVREAFHLKIGRMLRKWSSAEEMNLFIFVIVDQLHRGAHLVIDCGERTEVSQLSLMAGRKAYDMCAFLPALAFFQAGIGLLTDEHWCLDQDLCLDLHNSCAEIEFILGKHDGMKMHLDEVLTRAILLGDKLRAYCTLIQALGSQGCFVDAINTAIAVLGELGEFLPIVVAEATIKDELLMTQQLLHGKSKGSLLQLETMEDVAKREAMKLLKIMTKYVYTVKKEYFPLAVCRMVRLSIQHGVCRESALGFAAFGVLLISLGDHALGHHFGKLALSFHERFQAKDITVQTIVYGIINPWIEPIQSSLPHLNDAVESGLAVGDTEYAFVAASFYVGLSFWSGRDLGPLADELERSLEQMLEYKQYFMYGTNIVLQPAVLYLLGRTGSSTKTIGDMMDQNKMTTKVGEESESVRMAICRHKLFNQMYLEYLFGEYDLAWETAEKERELAEQGHGAGVFYTTFGSVFYSGLTALTLARKEGRRKYACTIDKAMEKIKVWAASTPWNCQHQLELMKAEYAYLEGDISSAAKHYFCAAQTASERRFINHKALALERAGIFHSEVGDHNVASRFFVEARDCYNKWGAQWKAEHVYEQYM